VKVEFFQGTTKLGEALSSPYAYTWSNAASGNYSLTAIATDDKGAVTTSASVNITVSDPVNTAPSVAITAPIDNATFTTPIDITIDATASDTDGTVVKVEFFQGTTKLGEALSSPYAYTWSNAASGNYSLTAIATDNLGAVSTSASVNVVVSTQEPILKESFVVYPNPSSDKSTIQFVLRENSNYSLSLYNLQGAFIYLLIQGRAEAGVQYTQEFDGSQLANGLYLLRLKSQEGIQTFRLLLNR